MPEQTPKSRAVVLLSGGLDSATALAIAQHQDGMACSTLAIDYGQRHRHELAAAERVAHAAGVSDHRVITIDLRAIGGSSLTSDTPVPKDRDHGAMSSAIPSTYVPARNLIFLSISAAVAEVTGARFIYLGINALDYSGYPDCRQPFIDAFQQTVNLATKAGTTGSPLEIRAPLVHMTKAQIIRAGTSLSVNYALTHSCYDPIVRDSAILACGHCDSCILRREGFVAAGVTDPTGYAR